MIAHFKVTYKTRSVNSIKLLDKIVAVMEEASEELIYVGRQELFLDTECRDLVSYVELYMEELKLDNVITQSNIRADHRNNPVSSMRAGKVNVLVTFRQTNCVNVSQIEFIITKQCEY